MVEFMVLDYCQTHGMALAPPIKPVKDSQGEH